MTNARPRESLARWFGTAAATAVSLNFLWEMAQAYLYESMGDVWPATRRCLTASLGDGALVLFILALTCRPWRGRMRMRHAFEYAAVIGLAIVLAAAVEWWGLNQRRWTYRPDMPTIPGTRLGVVPLLQMAVLTPLTLHLADRITRR